MHSRPPPSKGGRLLLTYTLMKLAARVGLAPTPLGLTGRHATLTPPGNLERGARNPSKCRARPYSEFPVPRCELQKLVLSAGFPPASVRLEGGCLVYSATTALKLVSAVSRRRDTSRSLGYKPSALAATLRAEKEPRHPNAETGRCSAEQRLTNTLCVLSAFPVPPFAFDGGAGERRTRNLGNVPCGES